MKTKSGYDNNAHFLEVSAEERCIHAYRIYDNGEKVYLARFDLPEKTAFEDKKGFHEFGRMMAMFLFCDSPIVRELMEFEKMDNVVDPIYD